MAQFYKELKDLRESRGISLEEISERTKHKNEDLPGARGTCGPEVPYAIGNLVP